MIVAATTAVVTALLCWAAIRLHSKHQAVREQQIIDRVMADVQRAFHDKVAALIDPTDEIQQRRNGQETVLPR